MISSICIDTKGTHCLCWPMGMLRSPTKRIPRSDSTRVETNALNYILNWKPPIIIVKEAHHDSCRQLWWNALGNSFLTPSWHRLVGYYEIRFLLVSITYLNDSFKSTENVMIEWSVSPLASVSKAVPASDPRGYKQLGEANENTS